MSHDYETNTRGHVWKTDGIGNGIDIFAYEDGGQYCNGPVCVNCGYGFCHHCKEGKVGCDCTALGKGESHGS